MEEEEVLCWKIVRQLAVQHFCQVVERHVVDILIVEHSDPQRQLA